MEARATQMEMTIQEAVNLANEIERMESALSQMKKSLREYVKANGPVETETVTWKEVTSETYAFSGKQLKEFAQLIFVEGYNPWDFLHITPATVRKLGFSRDVLEQYMTVKNSVTVKSVKK